MLTFRGGREVQGYPVGNEQAISEINESLGLGIEQFMVVRRSICSMPQQNICKPEMRNLPA